METATHTRTKPLQLSEQDDVIAALAALTPRIRNLRTVKQQRQALVVDHQGAVISVQEIEKNLERLSWAAEAKKPDAPRRQLEANYGAMRKMWEAQLETARVREKAAQTALQALDASPDMQLYRFMVELKSMLGDV